MQEVMDGAEKPLRAPELHSTREEAVCLSVAGRTSPGLCPNTPYRQKV